MPVPVQYPSTFARLEHALQLRREGRTYQEIGDRMGISPSQAQKVVSKAIGRVLKETAEEVRQLELSRVEVLIKALWDKVMTDLTLEPPNFTRFDRLKALLEMKLKWCGAQAVIEDNRDQRVQIFVQKFTDRVPKQIGSGTGEVVAVPDNQAVTQ